MSSPFLFPSMPRRCLTGHQALKIALGNTARTILTATCSAILISGCAPIDQRTFNPQAGRPPVVETPTPERHKTARPAPFIGIMAGTPPADYAQAVDKAVKTALSRKRNVLFIVETLTPMAPTPAQQAQALANLTQQLAVPVADRILAAGAEPIQLEMRAQTDPALPRTDPQGEMVHGMVRIDVR